MRFLLALLVLMFGLQGPGPATTGAQASSTFTPKSIPGLKVWFSADCITLTGTTCSVPSNGSTITGWSDRSGNANNASTTVGTCTFNTNQLNGLPAVNFASCREDFTTVALPASATAFVVFQNTSLSAIGTTFGGAHDNFEGLTNFHAEQGLNCAGVINVGTGTAAADTSWHQTNISFTNSTSLAFRIDETTDTASIITLGSCGAGPRSLGGDFDGGAQFLTGNIAEAMYWDVALTSTQISEVESYLHTRYGI